ncbi:hypothetical protein FIBSPDRAFT_852798 [Athelia psychrophila]|uniref:Uncharacterized protein n=1 Tax=Athelia psychrophila TaxID=1759441 RepID=A0A166RHZ2_9AGAM|nr:hypothetical protein FIBSPDRAFT_852798 [Fibularhizoctonia sp. CBS 109695]
MNGKPTNPFSVLPPAIAGQYQASCYILAATLTAYVYDWLLSISEEQAIYARYGLPRSNAIYLLSRVTSFAYLLSVAAFAIAPVDNCQAVEWSAGVFSVLAAASTSFLFLLRVRAVYSYSAVVITLFGCLWVGMIGGTAYYIKSLTAHHISTTDRCTESSTNNYLLILPTVVLGITDTIIFTAISYRLARNSISADAGRCGWTRAFVKGDGLYSLSKALLKSGQVYFLAIIGAFLANLVVMTASGVPDSMQYILLPAYVGFTNIMSCAVFRGVALGVYHDKDAALALAELDKERKVFITDTESENGGSGQQMTLTSDSAICESGGMRLGTVLEGTLLEESGGSGFV